MSDHALLKEALVEIRLLREELERYSQPIAIIGLACRFPGGVHDADSFWNLLLEGVDGVGAIPATRWPESTPVFPGTRWAGLLSQEEVEGFDAAFFGVAPREAVSMDPQQRLLLEVSWEALEAAGRAPDKLAGTATGVFLGMCNHDYGQRIHALPPQDLDAYHLTGNLASVAAGRIAYVLGLQGPTLTLDTACSSSLVAVHLAVNSLRAGECSMALAGGVNLLLSAATMEEVARTQALSPDGRCRAFDARANGFVRAEGCAMLVLKPLALAQRDGDPIIALIVGSAVNQDGRSSGLTAPNVLSQQALLQQALHNARVEPQEVSYIEAHGTGTSLGDPIEVEALKAVLGQPRDDGSSCWLGSVKSNIGHSEAAAGVAGLVKVVLALQREMIPANLHFETLNPRIDLRGTPLRIASAPQDWPRGPRPRVAGVSSFGLSGTNAHVLLEEAPAPEAVRAHLERPAHLLVLSASQEEALQDSAARLADWLQAHPRACLADVCYSAALGRSQLSYRLALPASSTQQLALDLRRGVAASVPCAQRPRIAFLFSGQGSQYPDMGRLLYQTQPVFRQQLEQCQSLLQLPVPLLSVLFPVEGRTALIHRTLYTQPALFALEYSLAQLWRSWGIIPEAVIGHSVGEVAAACLAGVFSLEDGLRLISARARLMDALSEAGGMVSLAMSEAEVLPFLAGSGLSLAAVNGPKTVVVSGAQQPLESMCLHWESLGHTCKRLHVSHAFHSVLMEPMLAEFEQVASTLTYSPPRIPLISNLSGRPAGPEVMSAAYWCRHVREAVRFADGFTSLVESGIDVFLEVGPQPVLLGLGASCAGAGQDRLWLSSLARGQDAWNTMLESLGQLFLRGVNIDWAAFDAPYLPARRKLSLPTYAFQRRRAWLSAPAVTVSQAPEWRDWLYDVAWQALSSRDLPSVPPDPLELGAGQDPAQLMALEGLARHYLESIRLEDLENGHNRPLIEQLRRSLEGAPASCPPQRARELLAGRPELALLESCGPFLESIMRDQVTALSRLVPEGDSRLLQRFYHDSDTCSLPNRCLAQRVSQWLASMERPRILEIGAGTGATTAALLEALGERSADYLVSDISPSFLVAQRQRWASRQGGPSLSYATLDIERDPCGQGLAPHSFDVVVAANVLHATRDLSQVLRHVARLLAPGGALVLLEGTTQRCWIDLTFGLTEGWWRSERPYPLLSGPQWCELLSQAGWGQPGACEPAGQLLFPQTIVLARAPALPEPDLTVLAPASPWQALASHDGPVHSAEHVLLAPSEVDFDDLGRILRETRGRLWILTRGAWSDAPQLAALWGWGRTLALEEPGRFGGLIDIAGPADERAVAAVRQHLRLCIAGGSPELEAAWTGSQWEVPRLLPHALKERVNNNFPIFDLGRTALDLGRPECENPSHHTVFPNKRVQGSKPCRGPGAEPLGVVAGLTYLVTGGLNGLGLRVARWLVDKGATSLVLVSRHSHAEAEAPLRAWRAAGVKVVEAYADVAAPGALEVLRQAMPAEGGRLAGVFHCAGLLADAPLAQQTGEHFRRVSGPKADGAAMLEELTRGLQLDFFVLFSSTSGLLGSAGQANHAAANASLDALAWHRRARGQTAVSINWGFWSQIGSAAGQDVTPFARSRSLLPMDPDQAVAAMEALLSQDLGPQAVIASIDWSTAQSRYGTRPLLAGWLSQKEVPTAPPADRSLQVLDHVRAAVARVLGLAQPQDLPLEAGFFQLGMDSLTSVELRNDLQKRLQLSLPTTVAFDFPTVRSLADHLESLRAGPSVIEEVPIPHDIAALTLEEAAAQLLLELS